MTGCTHCKNIEHFCPHNNSVETQSKIIPLFSKETPVDKNSLECKKHPADLECVALMRFVQELGLPQMFASLPDPRDLSRIIYSLDSLSMWAFYTCAFRQGSKNAMQTTIDSIADPDHKEGILHLLGIEHVDRVSHSSVVDAALSRIEPDRVNDILFQLFDRIINRKIFYHHQASLLPYNTFQIGTDGYWTHTYTHPHASDDQGNNICPYCLPRVHNRGKPNEFTNWVHVIVTFVLICGEGVTLPLYAYPLKASQVKGSESHEKFKEECELAAAHAVLPLFRARYPRQSFTFFGDALYANRPFIRLCKQLKFDYIIVLKEGIQKKLNKRCDELEKTEIYQQHYTHQETTRTTKGSIIKKAAWFNTVEMGEEIFTNVLRFEETMTKSNGNSRTLYKGAWICSRKIFNNNCFKMAKRGRSRWNHEDLHNTCKRRGFDIKHDMARSHPNLLIIWKIMVFIAFFVTELFSYTSIAQELRKTRSLMKFFRDLLQQFAERSWKVISLSPVWEKHRVQFRFHFGGT